MDEADVRDVRDFRHIPQFLIEHLLIQPNSEGTAYISGGGCWIRLTNADYLSTLTLFQTKADMERGQAHHSIGRLAAGAIKGNERHPQHGHRVDFGVWVTMAAATYPADESFRMPLGFLLLLTEYVEAVMERAHLRPFSCWEAELDDDGNYDPAKAALKAQTV